MIPRPITQIEVSDIETLIAQQASESRTLEFKRDIVGSRDEDKREFLADISAFANSSGGDIIFGIEQIDGSASAIRPLNIANVDAEQSRLEAVLRSGIEPRLPLCEFRWLQVGSDNYVLVIRVGRSWVAPHRVTFRDHSKFYARSSTGKYPMDVAELRLSFRGSEALIERIKAFRHERSRTISENEGPILLRDGTKLIFHILPISAFTTPLSIAPDEATFFSPLGSGYGANFLHTLEGFTTYSSGEEAAAFGSYTLVFRNGIVEAAAHIGYADDKGSLVYPELIEKPLLENLTSYFQNLQRLQVSPPFYVSMTLLEVRNCSLVSGGNAFFRRERKRLNRDTLFFPEIFCEDAVPDYLKILRPLFDLLWQAFGYPHSYSFDKDGQYIGRR